MRFVDGSTKLLGWGSLAFGVWGLIHPGGLTRLMGDDPELGRLLGVRDAIVGGALLALPGPLPLAMRVASDLHDAIRLRDRSPVAALGATAIALWGAAALAAGGARAAGPGSAGRRQMLR